MNTIENEACIRSESADDYKTVETLTREAFWNLHVPGCDEHYLVHVMRQHPDFIPELAFVAILDDTIVGNIMYTRSALVNEQGEGMAAITFGPVSVLPEYQKRGIGSALIRHSLAKAKELGHRVVVIEGHPYNYCKHGFRGSKSLGVSDADGRYPFSLLVLELKEGALAGHSWHFKPSGVYELDEQKAAAFDAALPPKEKTFSPSQEEFRIASAAFVE